MVSARPVGVPLIEAQIETALLNWNVVLSPKNVFPLQKINVVAAQAIRN